MSRTDPSGLLPLEIQGWKAVTPDGLYNNETLYEYIDGSAEVYRELNVRSVLARRYVRDGSPEILADLFDMGTAADAFGAFHHDSHEGEAAGIGQESEYESGALAFWKGRYFLSVMTFEETEETRRAVLALGSRIAEAIRDEGAPPDLIRLLPERGLIREEIRYFHTKPSLDRYLALSERNLLGLEAGTEALLARYRPSPGKPGDAPPYALLLVSYDSPSRARAALDRLKGEILPGAEVAGRTAGGTWAAARTLEDLLVGVFEAPSRETAETALTEVIDRRGAQP